MIIIKIHKEKKDLYLEEWITNDFAKFRHFLLRQLFQFSQKLQQVVWDVTRKPDGDLYTLYKKL